MLKQAFPQMSEISVRIAFRCDSFVHLNDMHAFPRHIFLREIAKHDPRGFAPTHCHDKLAASCNRHSRFFSDELCGLMSDRLHIAKNFDLHHAASLATANAFFSPGLLQPPGGVTRSTSAGPQVFGVY
jgi:hypothetical protein